MSLQQRARPLRSDRLNLCYEARLRLRPLPWFVPPIRLLTRLQAPIILLMTGVTLLALPRLTRHAWQPLATVPTLVLNRLVVLLLWPTIVMTVFLPVSCRVTFPLTFPKLLARTMIPFLRRKLTTP